ncbi:MAG: hypothetical protein U0V64_01840 [Cyclobacteriaceae bacterium]
MAGGSGRYGDSPLHELTLDGRNQTLNLNLTSLMLSNQAAVKALLASGTRAASSTWDRCWATRRHRNTLSPTPTLRRSPR